MVTTFIVGLLVGLLVGYCCGSFLEQKLWLDAICGREKIWQAKGKREEQQ